MDTNPHGPNDFPKKRPSSSLTDDDATLNQKNKRLKIDRVRENHRSAADLEKCSICLATFRNQEIGLLKSCGHYFCSKCIKRWSKRTNTCPIDRIPFHLIHIRKNYKGETIKLVPVKTTKKNDDEEEDETENDDDGDGDEYDDDEAAEFDESDESDFEMLVCDIFDNTILEEGTDENEFWMPSVLPIIFDLINILF